jgi:hypothetical protein
MSLDFFLQNRAHQVHRLCNSVFQIPAQRSKLPSALVEFYGLLDRICSLASDESSATEGTQLSDSQRRDMLAFEKVIVDNRFSSDSQVKEPAVALIRAIFSDADYFSGLKPLPQYTDVFAYEFLFPSWLNMLTALMLPRADNGKPRMSGAQQGNLFAYLSKLNQLTHEHEKQLTGTMTFIARRFDAPECECLLQRLVDLISVDANSILQSIDSLELATRDARDFASRLHDLLTVRHSSHKWPSVPQVRITESRPTIRVLPARICAHLQQLESAGKWSEYAAIAQPLSFLVKSEHMLENVFSSLLDRYPERAEDLLQILVPHGNCILCDEGQVCVAKLLARKLEVDPNAPLSGEQEFSRSMAGHLKGFSESMLAYFCRQFINDPKNSELLLSSVDSPERQKQLVSYLLGKASKTDDDKNFMNLLCCATVITAEDEVRNARHALQAIEAVVSNRSIGSKEFSDLVGDLQANTDQALRYLACPILAGVGKSPRLASLYLTLNEITEVFQASGNVGNFSVVRAKYASFG